MYATFIHPIKLRHYAYNDYRDNNRNGFTQVFQAPQQPLENLIISFSFTNLIVSLITINIFSKHLSQPDTQIKITADACVL